MLKVNRSSPLRDLNCYVRSPTIGGCYCCADWPPSPSASWRSSGPGLTLITLTWLWGAYAMTDGVIAIWAAFNASGGDAGPRWWLGLSGVVSILAGVLAFYYTGMTTLVLLMFIAIWAIIIGAIQIWGAIALRSVLQREWLLVLSGALSIAFGVILMVQPGTGALAFVWMIAWYAIFFGCLYIGLAFRLKQYKRT
jgi:uncharacterized membrane protein HdeD (DUF308 family)